MNGGDTARGASTRLVGLLYTRIAAGSSHLAQLWFDAAVLDKYRALSGAKVVRTNTVGRLSLAQWSVDFGIAEAPAMPRRAGEGEASETSGTPVALVHLSIADVQHRIPEAERIHWAAHAVTLPLSPNYVAMQLTRGACIDDGEVRPW